MDFKDFELIKKSIKEMLTMYDAPSMRYKGIALSTIDQKSLEILGKVIRDELNDYDIWIESGKDNAPSFPCTRSEFLEMCFEDKHPGLVIISPEEWMFDWTSLDKRTFWSALSEAYGRHNVIVLFAETYESMDFVKTYFNPFDLVGLPVSIWISKYQQR